MKVGKASGIDNVTKYEYEADLKENIENLVGRMKRVTTHIINTWVEKRKYYPCIIVIGSVYLYNVFIILNRGKKMNNSLA